MLSELVKNSRRSDRELAKAIGTSQPTATRVRIKLEKEGYLKEYTAIPDLGKIGYTMLALTFVKLDKRTSQTRITLDDFRHKHIEVFDKSPNAVMLMKRGMGLGYDAVIVSLHKDYESCDQFRETAKEYMSAMLIDLDTFLINLAEERTGLPLTFSQLSTQLLQLG